VRGPGQRSKCPTCAEKDAEIARIRESVAIYDANLRRDWGVDIQGRLDAEARATGLDTLMRHWKGEHDAMEARATAAEHLSDQKNDEIMRRGEALLVLQQECRDLRAKLAAAEQERDDQIAAHVVTQKLLNGAIADKAAAEEDALERQSIARELLTKLKAAEQERDTWKSGKELADVTTRELMTKLAAAERREAERASDVPVEAVTGITVAGARAFWALKDLEKRHEALRVAVAIAISNPYPESWPEARVDLGKALASPSTPSPAPSAREKFAACVHCGLIANPEICSRCGRERDSGILPIDSPLRQPSPPPRSAPREAGAQPEAGEPKEAK
jgi:hypothetical protein